MHFAFMLHMRFCRYKSKFLTLFLLTVLLSCSGCFEFLTGGNTSPSSVTSTLNSEVSPTTETTTSFSPDGDVSLPISYLDASQIYAPTADAAGLFPVVTFPDAISWNSEATPQDADGDGFYDDAYLAVSADSAALAAATNSNKNFVAHIFKNAFATSSTVQLCPISTDNRVECFLIPKQNRHQHCIWH